MRLLSFVLLSTVSCGVALAARVEYNWNVTYTNANPDNLFERRVIGINGVWPPPMIEVEEGDTLAINLVNQLDVPTALHSHGMFQNGSGYMDGAVGVTQCPIPPGSSFTYEFNITQFGSYWAHAHFKGQYMDGFRMPLVIHGKNESYTYDHDVTIPIQDWYHASIVEGNRVFLNENNPTGAEPVPQSGFMFHNINDSLTFEPGKTYRLRLINMSGFSMFYFSIDGHNLDVIEVDGVEVERQTVQSVHLTAAQRISVLVTAKNATDTNYYMHADMNIDMFDIVPEDLNPNITQYLYYNKDINNFAPSEDVGMASTFDDFLLTPKVAHTAVNFDQRINLTFNFDVTNDGINRGMFNEIPYLSPLVPTLNTLMTQGEYAMSPEVYGPQTQAHILNHLSMIEVVVNNLDAGFHPFHLHGHVFQVVGRGNGVYDGNNNSMVEWHLDNPLRRDTISVPPEGFVLLRFRADNPGVWFFHCHIEWHLVSGLAATFIEAPDVAQKRLSIPTSLKDVCTAGGNKYEGNAAGKSGLNLKGAPDGIRLLYDGFTTRGKGAMAGCILAAIVGITGIVLYSKFDPLKAGREIAEARAQKN